MSFETDHSDSTYNGLTGAFTLDELEDLEDLAGSHSQRSHTVSPKQKRKRASARVIAEMIEHDAKTGAVAMGAGSGFTPTFSASRHERAWIMDSLGGFYEKHLILDVLAQVRGGKEATVYCCAAHPETGVELLAGKVYRPRIFRTLSNDALYREGRSAVDQRGKDVRDKRALRAIAKKSRFGQQLLHGSWLHNEYETMDMLQNTGVPVPKLYGLGENAILMEYLGEPGAPAPALDQITLAPDEVRPLFDQLIESVRLMLKHNRVHADLSAYNVLYWEGEVKIIDFPQAIDPYFNPSAYALFARDVKRICQYFARYGKVPNPAALAAELWASVMPGQSIDIQQDRSTLMPASAQQRVAPSNTHAVNGQKGAR
jgi:RIO kinase 1